MTVAARGCSGTSSGVLLKKPTLHAQSVTAVEPSPLVLALPTHGKHPTAPKNLPTAHAVQTSSAVAMASGARPSTPTVYLHVAEGDSAVILLILLQVPSCLHNHTISSVAGCDP